MTQKSICFELGNASSDMQVAMRKIGFRHLVCHLDKVDVALGVLSPEIAVLHGQLPHLNSITAAFLSLRTLIEVASSEVSDHVSHSIGKLPVLQVEESESESWCAGFLLVALQKHISATTPVKRAALAIYWTFSSWSLSISRHDLLSQESGMEWIFEIIDSLDPAMALVHEQDFDLSKGVFSWVTSLSKAASLPNSKIKPKRAIELSRLSEQLCRSCINLGKPVKLKNASSTVDDQFWGNRGGDVLVERELLDEHFTAPTEEELQLIKDTIDNTKIRSGNGYEEIEAFICAVGVSLGKTPVQILDLDIYIKPKNATNFELGKEYEDLNLSTKHECLVFRHTDGVRDTNHRSKNWWWRVTWYRPLDVKNKIFQVDLPKNLVKRLLPHFLLGQSTVYKFRDILPWTKSHWEKRLTNWFYKKTKITDGRARIILRRMLALQLYQNTASRAMMIFLYNEYDQKAKADKSTTHSAPSIEPDNEQSGILEQRITRSSVQYYITPNSERNSKLYQSSLGKVLPSTLDRSNNDEAKDNEQRTIIRKTPLKILPLRELYELLIEAQETRDLYKIHNAYSAYVLGSLIIGTGHRPSRTPFHFPWDLLLDEGLAFICDKRIIGSEARFVPLCKDLIALVQQYRLYLQALVDYLNLHEDPCAVNVQMALSGPVLRSGSTKNVYIGHFFIFKPRPNIEGLKSLQMLTLSTARVATYAINRNPIDDISSMQAVRAWRSQLANYLWDKGMTEPHIRALLGHNDENHLFGLGSSWSIDAWASRVRPHIETYLKDMNITVVLSPMTTTQPGFQFKAPSINLSGFGYEGRLRNESHAKLRAKQILASVIPEHWLDSNGDFEATSADLDRVLATAKATFTEDGQTRDLLNLEVRTLVESIRSSGRRIKKILYVNLDQSVGPVSFAFSRYYCIAEGIRRKWPQWSATGTSSHLDITNRITKLAVGLIVCDAVMDSQRIKSILKNLWSESTLVTHEGILVRAEIQLASIRYETAVLLSKETSALAMGLKSKGEWVLTDGEIEQHLKDGIGNCINDLVTNENRKILSLERLCKIFNAWWFIRLPGYLYAGASGQRPSPAPSAKSINSLLGYETPTVLKIADKVKDADNFPLEIDSTIALQEKALQSIRGLFAISTGIKEDNETSSTKQRARLFEILDEHLPKSLQYWISQQEIVKHIVEFIRYLAEVGGDIKEKLRFHTLRDYINYIAPQLINLCWDLDIITLSPSKIDEIFNKVVKSRDENVNNGSYVIQLFGEFLVAEYEVEVPLVSRTGSRTRVNIRGELIGPAAIRYARSIIDKKEDLDSEMKNAITDHLGISYGYGLRRDENYGLRASEFPGIGSDRLRVQNNTARLLKTEAGRRYLTTICADDEIRKSIIKRVELCRLRGKNDWIYGLVENYKTKFNESKLVKESVLAIREVCANNSLTTHSLRNSFCNRVILAVAPATGNVELARRLRESLLEVVDQRWISHLKSKTLDTNDWPFWIDRVEMMMGHEGMYSFYWYWKCDFVCLAEHASQSNKTLANEWRVGDLAKILNISPGLVSQRSKFLRGDSAEQAFDWEAVVSDRIKLHSLHKPRKVLSGSQPSVEAKTVEIDASIFHSLLISRFKNGWQIQDLTSHLPNGICLKEPHLELVLAQYQNLVRSTGIDDFEPKTSELLTVQRPRYTEIVSKSGERQTKLQLAWEFLKTDIGNQVLSSIQYWSRSVNYANSFWVIQNDNQIKPCIEFLIAIGFDPKTLIIWATDSYEFQIAIDKISDFQIPLKRSPTRFTKGPQHIKESECAIAIEEITPKNIRNSREIPRILLTLISCVLAKSDNT